jgi:ubiquinone/menaquinone biosynthesis C-methylase UbiE
VTPSSEAVAAGHAFYTRRSLKVYDAAILGFFSRTAWRCPAARIQLHFNQHVTANHLDVGVGTGYFLDHCRFPSAQPRVGLLDVSDACLERASARIARYKPEVHHASVFEPLDLGVPSFASVSLNYVLHCLPGTLTEKGVAFEHLAGVLEPGATVFGATLLSGGVRRNWYARQIMARNNRVGIFSNAEDDLDGLNAMLAGHLDNVSVETVGCVALFSGTTRPLH